MNPQLLRQILSGIRDAKPITDTAERSAMWERCWSESGSVPDYFGDAYYRNREGEMFAVMSERRYLDQLRNKLFHKYLRDIPEVSEFGCGTGHNLVPLIDSGKRLRGFDWSEAAVKKVRALGMESERFDMLNPVHYVLDGAVLTVHAMEQLGDKWHLFINYLWRQQKRPLCIHIEPIEEFYDPLNLPDFLALTYHRKRCYLSGFLTGLREMEARGEVEILEARRTYVGGLMHEANSVCVWRPK